ncbi:uncharacterized protein VTP21DRAFT_1086 [Calcarisporiella thermophila]|uniref:uncharacterized protein n=1 Tax=Calcarisporiella thermophila TaxID=911321 RepID=UPI0037427905
MSAPIGHLNKSIRKPSFLQNSLYRSHRLASPTPFFRSSALQTPSTVRQYASASGQGKPSSDKIWLIGSLVVSIPLFYKLTAPPDSYKASKTHVDEHTHAEPNIVKTDESVKNRESAVSPSVDSNNEQAQTDDIAEEKEETKEEEKHEEITENASIPEPSEEEAKEVTNSENSSAQESEVETAPEANDTTPLVVDSKPPAKLAIKDRYQYVLVGGGTASFSAMQAIREKDPHADILIIGSESISPYMRPPLSKEFWFSEDPDVAQTLKFKDWNGTERNALYQTDDEYDHVNPETLEVSAESKKVRLLRGVAVTDLDVEGQILRLANGKTIRYGKVLLATGGTPKSLPVLENVAEGATSLVTTYRSVDDFRRVDKIAKDGKHVVVIGGGFLGSELAVALAHRMKKENGSVTQIFPEDGNMAMVFPRYLIKWTTSKVENEGVQIKRQNTISSAQLTNDGKVQLSLSSGEEIVADHVIVAVGIDPATELARKAGLEIDETRGGVIVNAELEARTNVYCAGDMTSYHDIALGRRRVEHHDHAVLSGRAAGENMVGPSRAYKHQSMFWSDLGPHIGYEAVGVVDSSLKTVSVWAKAGSHDTPKEATQQPDNIRTMDPKSMKESEADETATQKQETAKNLQSEGSTAPVNNESYGKGVVFYLRDNKIVGVLMWNVFNKVPEARKVLKGQYSIEHINDLVKWFNIHDE